MHPEIIYELPDRPMPMGWEDLRNLGASDDEVAEAALADRIYEKHWLATVEAKGRLSPMELDDLERKLHDRLKQTWGRFAEIALDR